MPTNTSTTARVILACSKCGAALPDEAQFCLKCGKPISLPPKEVVGVEEPGSQEPGKKIVAPRPKPRIFLRVLLAILVLLVGWAAISDNPFALGLQELVGLKHDQPILETPFIVAGHNFRYYKFDLPEGSVNVSIVGQFTAAAEAKSASTASKDSSAAGPDDIQVYVLSEPAFAVWQNGYAASSVFDSGPIAKGTIQAELPAGAGVYYLVFNNRFASKASKHVNANVQLRYKSWMPDWVRGMKERFSNWIGL